MSSQVAATIYQGKTWEFALLYGGSTWTRHPITGLASLAPVRLTVPGHGMPNGWVFDVESVKTPRELNGEGYIALVVDGDTIEINALNGSDWSQNIQGGNVRFWTPMDITGWSARAMFKKNIKDSDPVLYFDSDESKDPDGIIRVDTEESSFTLVLDAAKSADLPVMEGVWDAEVVDPEGRVFSLVLPSEFSVVAEVTR